MRNTCWSEPRNGRQRAQPRPASPDWRHQGAQGVEPSDPRERHDGKRNSWDRDLRERYLPGPRVARHACHAKPLDLDLLPKRADCIGWRGAGQSAQRRRRAVLRPDQQQPALEVARISLASVILSVEGFQLRSNAIQLAESLPCPNQARVRSGLSGRHQVRARRASARGAVPTGGAHIRTAGGAEVRVGGLLAHWHDCAAPLAEDGCPRARHSRFPLCRN